MDPTSATSAARVLPASAAAAAAVGPGPLHHVRVTGSTNADLVDAARHGDTAGLVLVADHQTAGRGRLERTWEDDPGGALLVSMRLRVDAADAASAVRALGAAARAALDRLCTSRVLVKWPNDIVVADGPAPGKLAGVLAEFVPDPNACVIVGIGVNLAPIPRQPGASSVAECGGPDSRDLVLEAILRELAVRIDDPSAVLAELRSHSATIGTRVRADLPGGRELIGKAADLAPDGELIIEDDAGVCHVVGAGDVVQLRPV